MSLADLNELESSQLVEKINMNEKLQKTEWPKRLSREAWALDAVNRLLYTNQVINVLILCLNSTEYRIYTYITRFNSTKYQLYITALNAYDLNGIEPD